MLGELVAAGAHQRISESDLGAVRVRTLAGKEACLQQQQLSSDPHTHPTTSHK
jgi:hypothetical protein